jgi:hypothetical protein
MVSPKYFFSCIFLWCVSTAGAQYSEWKEFGLKGPVQSVTSRFYTGSNFNLTNFQIADSSAWTYKTIRFFNVRGMVEWYSSTNRFNLDTTSNLKAENISYVSYKFDSTHTKTSGAAYSKQTFAGVIRDVSTEHYQYAWLSPHRYIESVYDSTGVRLISTFEYELDADFFIIKELHQYSWGNSSVKQTYTVNYTKNDSGQIGSCTEQSGSDNEPSVKTYDYKSSDTYGNPTCFIIHVQKNNAVFDVMVVKEYTYFTE